MKIFFKVLPPTRIVPKSSSPTFILVQDNWNDYSFQTTYSLHYVTAESDMHIGNVKILKKGQTKSDGLLIKDDFEILDDNFVSVGTSLDYYEHFASFDEDTKFAVLDALQDAVKNEHKVDAFSHEDGWRVSVFRDQSDSIIDEFFTLARAMLSGNYTSMPNDDFGFGFKVHEWEEVVDFDFRASLIKRGWSYYPPPLPSRVMAIIGRNGSGKSTLLARLARVAHGNTLDRRKMPLSKLGALSPDGVGFPRIITISYSAFDSFELPGISFREKEQIVRDVRSGSGRFIFCGLRDIATELEFRQKEENENNPAAQRDRLEKTFLKPIEELGNEFLRTLQLAHAKGRSQLFDRAMHILASDPSWDKTTSNSTIDELIANNPKGQFLSWSTGHKIVMQILVNLVAYVTPRSLVLMDEPETHLHPPMLASLMHATRAILDDQRAFAVVATHSPVVLQETLAKHVRLVRRAGSITTVSEPSVETFGENVGVLTSEIFGMNSQAYDFYSVLDRLVSQDGSIEKIESRFEPNGMSNQARAYVMSKLAKIGDAK